MSLGPLIKKNPEQYWDIHDKMLDLKIVSKNSRPTNYFNVGDIVSFPSRAQTKLGRVTSVEGTKMVVKGVACVDKTFSIYDAEVQHHTLDIEQN